MSGFPLKQTSMKILKFTNNRRKIFSLKLKRPIRALLELPRNWWSSHSSIGADHKFKKLDLIRLNKEKIDKHSLPKPVNWNVTDGDYMYEMTENEESQVYSIEGRKRLEKIYFGVALVFASLITLLFSSIASSIKNF